ncbi:unnamed protein product [Mucor hiemalis]
MAESKVTLESRQRRIRHIRSIAGRNIVWTNEESSLKLNPNSLLEPSSSSHTLSRHATNSTFNIKRSESSTSLSATAVEDSSLMKRAYKKHEQHFHSIGLLDAYITLHTGNLYESEFYKSEMIPNTINPTFRALPFPFDWMNWYDAASNILVIRLWTRHSIPEFAGQHTEPVLGYQSHSTPHNDFQLLLEWQLDLNALSWIGKSCSDLHYSFPENTLLFELEDGFYTAPEIKNMVTSKRSSVLDLDQQWETASIRTQNSSIVKGKRSYTYNNIMKLSTVKDFIFDTQKSSEEVRQDIQDLLDEQDRGFRLKRELNLHRCKLVEKEAQIIQQKKLLVNKREQIMARKKTLEDRKMDLAESLDRYLAGTDDLKENEEVLEKNIKMRQTIFHTLNRRKKELIADLFSIYPIEQSYDDSQQFRIRGIYLPNSIYDGQNAELIATALGFTAHLVSMLAFYLEIPLRYPTIPMGSRAIIRDVVSVLSGSRE